MAVKTGYTTGELVLLADAILERKAALVAGLPSVPLGQLLNVCCCDRCIDDDAYSGLCQTSPPVLTRGLVERYLGGAGAVDFGQDPEAQREARVILTHVLFHLGDAVLMPRAQYRDVAPDYDFVSADYRTLEPLETGVIETLPPDVARDLEALLSALCHYAVAVGHPLRFEAMVYLARMTDGFARFLDVFRNGPPRRVLRFWTAIADGYVTSGAGPSQTRGVDLMWRFADVPGDGRARLLAFLECPRVERIIERYAFAARDEEWLRYLSRLLEWREATILATRHSTYVDGAAP